MWAYLILAIGYYQFQVIKYAFNSFNHARKRYAARQSKQDFLPLSDTVVLLVYQPLVSVAADYLSIP